MSPFSGTSGASSGGSDSTVGLFLPPVLSGLTQVNINGTNQTVVQNGNTVVLSSVSAANNDLSMVVQNGPSAHWQLTAALRMACGGPASTLGVCFRNTNNSNIIGVFLLPGGSGFTWGVNLNSNPSTFSRGVRGGSGMYPADPYWLRLKWDGTSMRVRASASGNANEFATHDIWTPGADYGWAQGPDQAGVWVASNSSTVQTTAQILSWNMESLA